ncbi:P-type ATpase3 [Cryptosporidium xiaoi]|uniref:P-type ATpase3 n=1 Tax=Cryptosporidium xiaoi TaxID=659607 RepID=A0AAV9XWY5_9CRYT
MSLHNPSEPIISWDVGKITIYNLLIAGIMGYFWSFYRNKRAACKFNKGNCGESLDGAQRGYKQSAIGSLLKLLVIIATFLPFLFIMIHTYDTAGCDKRQLALYWNTRAITFICLWLECFAICFFYRITKTFFKQFFLVPNELKDADYVCIWQKVSGNLDLTNNTINSKNSKLKTFLDAILRPFNKLSAFLNNDFSGYNLYTVRVNKGDKSGEKSYFELLCVRYWYSEKLERFTCMEESNGDSDGTDGEEMINNTGSLGNDIYSVSNVMELLQFRPNLCSNEKSMMNGRDRTVETPFSSDNNISQIRGLDSKTVFEQKQSYGRNEIVIEVPSLIYGLINEIMDPLTIFQLLIVSSYTFQGYIFFAVKWVPMMIISIIANIRTHFVNVRNVRKLAEIKSTDSIKTIRDGRIVPVEPHDLVPGDIVYLDENTIAPCDLMLLSGSAVVNESMLTGESAEVIKMPVSESESDKISPEDGAFSTKKHFLYAGTNITAVYGNVGKGLLFGDSYSSSPVCLQGIPTASTRSTDSFGNMTSVDSAEQDLNRERSSNQNGGTTALVIRTGISTLRGRIIRSILYPSKFNFDMFDQLPITWLCLTVLVIVLIVKQGGSYNWSLFTFFFALGTMNSIYPLYLGVLSTLSQNVACRRLFSRFKIKALAPTRIILGGKLRIMCFDKTGTLTHDHLEFIGLSPIETLNDSKRELVEGEAGENSLKSRQIYNVNGEANNTVYYSSSNEIVSVEEMKNKYQLAFLSIRSCTTLSHSPSNFGLSHEEVSNQKIYYSKLNGNDTDKALFSVTGSYFEKMSGSEKVLIKSIFEENACKENPNPVFSTLEILRVFPFDYNRRIMSVLVKCKTTEKYYLFTKGAPESIITLLADITSNELKKRINSLSSQGYYLIFSAYKKIDPNLVGPYLTLGRGELENELTPLGLLVFENSIRDEAPSVLSQLVKADVLPLMVTGDSPLTGLSTATKLGMVNSNGTGTALSELKHKDGSDPDGTVVWRCTETLRIIPDSEIYNETSPNKFSNLVLTGDCLRVLLREHYTRAPSNLDVEKGKLMDDEVSLLINKESRLEQILKKVNVYARMSPNDKVEIVSFFMRRGLVTGMVGDGGNDCGALRMAHVGISFSKGDASLVAPFNSTNSDLNSVLEVIREGRSSLATAMSFLLYLIYYGISTGLNETLLTHFAYSAIPDIASSFVAFFTHTMLLIGYIFSSPCRRLAAARPFGSIASLRFILLLLAPITVYLVGYIVMSYSLSSKSWFVSSFEYNMQIPAQNWFMRMDNIEFVSCWVYSSIQILTTALCYTMGSQFRRPFYKNPIVLISILINIVVYSVLIFTGPNPFTCMFRVNCDVDNIKRSVIKLFGITIIDPSSRPFSGPIDSNIMPFGWRIEFCLISLTTSFFTFLLFSLITRHKEECKTSIKKNI